MEIFMTKTELKELNVQQAIYYYDINTIEINKETAGILTIDLDFFNQLPKIITDYSRIIFCEAKNHKIIINKHCPNCSKKIFSDVDIDYGALHAATDIIGFYKYDNNKIPDETFSYKPEVMKKLVKEKNVKERLIELGFAKEEIETVWKLFKLNDDDEKQNE